MPSVLTSAAFVVFSSSLLGIILLFILRRIECMRDRRFGERVRMHADTGALMLKNLLLRVEQTLERIPWFLAALMRYGIHVGALSFARLARTAAHQAHLLAELVSHKRTFERRETKSQFLKDVGEYPRRNHDSTSETRHTEE